MKLKSALKPLGALIDFVKNTNKSISENKVPEGVTIRSGLEKSSSGIYGGLFAMLVTIALKITLGLELEQILGAIIIGYTTGKLILKKILPKIITRFRPEPAADRARSSQQLESEKAIKGNSEIYEAGQTLTNKVGSSIKKVLTTSAIVYFLTHYAAPFLEGSGSITEFLALLIPGLQIAAITIFAVTAVYMIAKRVNAYIKEQKSKREMQALASEGPNEVNVSKNMLLSIIGLTLVNASLITLQVTATLLGTKIVMPLAGILLGSFVAVYTLFYALPKGIYTIRLSLQKVNVDDIELEDDITKNPGLLDTPSLNETPVVSRARKLDIAAHSANKAIGLATVAIVAHSVAETLLKIGVIQHLAVAATAFVTIFSIALVIIPKKINTRRLNTFLKGDTCTNVKGILNPQANQVSELPELSITEKKTLVTKIQKHYKERPDVIIAALLHCSNKMVKAEVSKTITEHGFRNLRIAITKLDDTTLKEIEQVIENENTLSSIGPDASSPYTARKLREETVETTKAATPKSTPDTESTLDANADSTSSPPGPL